MVSISHPGAIVSARSTSRMLGIFGTKISPPCICSMLLTTKPYTLLERQPEARHARIGQRDAATSFLFLENRNHAAPAADNIPVARATEAGSCAPA